LRACPEPECPAESWLVKPTPVFANLWWVVGTADGALTTIAGAEPICPSCGTALVAILDLSDEGQPVALPARLRKAA
jgi:hypothetical protein